MVKKFQVVIINYYINKSILSENLTREEKFLYLELISEKIMTMNTRNNLVITPAWIKLCVLKTMFRAGRLTA